MYAIIRLCDQSDVFEFPKMLYVYPTLLHVQCRSILNITIMGRVLLTMLQGGRVSQYLDLVVQVNAVAD